MNYLSNLVNSDSVINPLLDNGYLPHPVIRVGIRRQLAERVQLIANTTLESRYESKMNCVKRFRTRAIVVGTSEQHYEIDPSILKGMLGPRMKFSACLYEKGGETLAQAEIAMLRLYVERAELRDGMSVLDLGCGWGSVSLFLAEVFPNSKITAFSNSHAQKEYIDSVAKSKSLSNLQVITGNITEYEFEASTFDRAVSIEFFEQVQNYQLLLRKVSTALKPSGKLFVHMFAHATTPYALDSGWMTEHFFTGGTMPSSDLLLYFQDDLRVKRQWWVNGVHYAKTCEDWLARMCKNKEEIWPGLLETYGHEGTVTWWNRWQVFYLFCAELFKWEGGDTWGVSHYLFEKP